ncbi:MAG: hypothetical protein MJ173_00790 [Clostridia bacterium]|nr:hypothetical protein [Clostridia bacterium]
MNGKPSKELLKAYEILYHETPLGFYNCGRLCDGLCCRGDESGMWLFPGEEELMKDKEGFEICETQGNYGYPMVICSGECDRRIRPLACRIFPLFPMVTEENGEPEIRIVIDPRAGMCPLSSGKRQFDTGFVKALRRAAQCMVRDPELYEYLKNVTQELEEIVRLKKMLAGSDF